MILNFTNSSGNIKSSGIYGGNTLQGESQSSQQMNKRIDGVNSFNPQLHKMRKDPPQFNNTHNLNSSNMNKRTPVPEENKQNSYPPSQLSTQHQQLPSDNAPQRPPSDYHQRPPLPKETPSQSALSSQPTPVPPNNQIPQNNSAQFQQM